MDKYQDINLPVVFSRAATFCKRIDDIFEKHKGDSFQKLLMLCLDDLNNCNVFIKNINLFSINEEFDDIRTSDIKYLLIEPLIALTTLKVDTRGDIASRVLLIIDSLRSSLRFLDIIDTYVNNDKKNKYFINIITEEDKRILDVNKPKAESLIKELNCKEFFNLVQTYSNQSNDKAYSDKQIQEDILSLIPKEIVDSISFPGKIQKSPTGPLAMQSPMMIAAGQSRQDKIARFKKKKQLEKSLEQLINLGKSKNTIRSKKPVLSNNYNNNDNNVKFISKDKDNDDTDIDIDNLLELDEDNSETTRIYEQEASFDKDNSKNNDDIWWEIEERYDEETLREINMNIIQLQIGETVDQIRDCIDEIVLLMGAIIQGAIKQDRQPQRDERMNNSGESQEDIKAMQRVINASYIGARQGPGYDRIEHMAGALSKGMVNKEGKVMKPFVLRSARETIKEGVFRPGHNLPSMTVDEFIQEEIQAGRVLSGGTAADLARQQAEQTQREAAQSTMDEHRQEEEETFKARVFDEFKDVNPAGYGNRYNKG